jgi:hypothetical protein
MPIVFDVVPPNEQTKFESVPGYEWANRLTDLVKKLTPGISNFPQSSFVVMTNDPDLTNERALTAGTGIAIVDGGPNGNVTISATGSGAPLDATYVVMSLNPTLTQERNLVAGDGITIVDGGPNSTVTLNNIKDGSSGWAWGDGSDGAFVYDGIATPAWASRSGLVYSLLRNVYHTTAVINSGITINAYGGGGAWAMYCNQSLTGIDATSNIQASGKNAAVSSGGQVDSSTFFYGGNSRGGDSNPGNGSVGTGQSTNGLGGAGGKGGDDGPRSGGAGGLCVRPLPKVGGLHGMSITPNFWVGRMKDDNIYGPSGAGGGGAGDGGLQEGGGGGAGGGFVIVYARKILGLGSFLSKGGNATNAAAGFGSGGLPGTCTEGGGGGGGGGGVIITVSAATNGWTYNVNGGKAGLGIGINGQAGVDGSVGTIFNFVF